MKTPQRTQQNKKGPMQPCTKRRSSRVTVQSQNTSKPNTTIKSMEKMYIADSGASLHMMVECSVSTSAGKEQHRTDRKLLEIQAASGIVVSIEKSTVCIQELGTYLCVKLAEDSLSVVVFYDCAMNWCLPTLGNQEDASNYGRKTITCCTDNFVPHVAVTQQKVTPSVRHDRARRTLVPATEVEGTM